MTVESLERIEENFREALKNREFCVWYQPQMDMRTGRPRGAEALVRWQKSDGMLITPAVFVPLFERAGLTAELDQEVMESVCRDICEADRLGFPFGPVSVNLSRLHAERKQIREQFRMIMDKYGVTEKQISFEIVETGEESANGAGMLRFAEDLQGAGFRIAMDDYGIGGSTLKLLQEICFDILKLDRHFVSRIGDPRADVILASTICMAGKLGVEVVAEGVETEKQIHFLLEHQCYLGQGYYYSRPLPKEEYIRWRRAYETAV